jgi:7-cyano-7-deazaguanine synthase
VTEKLLCVFSGGLDSTTLVYDAYDQGFDVEAVSFNYGQRHKKELEYAAFTAKKLNIRHDIIDLTLLTQQLAESGSSLVSMTDVPEGHYAEDNMKATVVPNRNMIMLSIAGGIAVARGACGIATAVHAGDHFIYPDCRPDFIEAVNRALVVGNSGFDAFDKTSFEGDEWASAIKAPYMRSSKEDIAFRAIELNVPFEKTWSCYKGGNIHCGKCGTCVERLEAIDGAIMRHIRTTSKFYIDRTPYEDSEFWKDTVRNGPAAI